MGTCEITINGVTTDVAVGKTILEAAAENGIEIPAMCYDPRLESFGACRMCLVEVAGARGPVAACTTPVKTGMAITTTTPQVEALRKTALEFMLAEHYGDCEAPCTIKCPAGIDIQGFIALIADGDAAASLRLIKAQMPFPASVGRVCPHFCESECRRNVVDEPLGIMRLHRYVADVDLESAQPYVPETAPATGKSVGVVGGGPAGLTAAYYLAIAGHAVTVYEACPELGGMLRYAIPEYRLPKDVVEREIATITGLCEEVKLDTKLGRDVGLDELRAKHDAVVVAVGAAVSQTVGVPGDDAPGSVGGLEFLAKYAAGAGPELAGQRVAVIGGGNTAIDCARTAVRLGAAAVTIIYRRSRSEMPAHAEEIEGAEEEGVEFRFLANPLACECQADGDGGLNLTCTAMELGEPDASGRRRPRPIPGSEFPLALEMVIWATGQTLDPAGLETLDKGRWGFIKVDEVGQTSAARVFATADCVTGPATVVEAVGAAHKTALIVDAYLGGRELELPAEPYNHSKGKLHEVNLSEYADEEKLPRQDVVFRAAAPRAKDFVEIDGGYGREQALAECQRCLSCGCQEVNDCLLRDYATEYGVTQPPLLREEPLPIVAGHELVVRDPNKCILCGSCVRICSEVQGAAALGFTERGYKVLVEPTLGRSLDESPCESCQQCISTCPTAALTAVVALPKPGPFALTRTPSVCPMCSVGCELSLGTKANLLVEIDSPLTAEVNQGNLCRHGATLTSRLAGLARPGAPLVRADGGLAEVAWDEALGQAARLLTGAKSGGQLADLAVYVSPRSTTEEAGLVQRFATEALGLAGAGGLPDNVRAGIAAFDGRACAMAEVAEADFVLAVDADMPELYPVAAISVRRAVANGARFVSLGSGQTKLDRLAAPAVVVERGQVSSVLRAMVGHALAEGIGSSAIDPATAEGQELAAIAAEFDPTALRRTAGLAPEVVGELVEGYLGAARPVIFAGLDVLSLADIEHLRLLAGLGRAPAAGAPVADARRPSVIPLTAAGNAKGLLRAGIAAAPAAGGEAGELLSRLGTSLDEAGFGGVVIAGLRDGEPFAICLAPYLTEAVVAAATVVLPGSTLFETAGSLTNAAGRTQRVEAALCPTAGRTNAEVLRELSRRLGHVIESPAAGVAGPAP